MLSKRTLIALLATLAAGPALAQAPAAQPAAKADPFVKLHTAEGDIVVELYADKAPITVRNFLHYVDTKRMDGATFYRSSTPPGDKTFDYGILQGGVGTDPKKLYPPIAHESTAKTGLSHTDGTISMTRYAPGTATANFSICVGDQTYLDADPKDPKANPGYAAFGRVVQGMDVVKKMLAAPRDPTKGVGVMKGEMLKKPIPILTARRVAWTPPAETAPAATVPPPASPQPASPQP
ncbi:peptidylprolyl isomerase [Phenylobacterium soli]|uniref:peptidylprolyl isomerase n=2 Tax=Phenylobacterium soli TaxID=2170551 RepID=A0A328AF44_9CAUL|nr:peptidylprolyl isomerase [Phenylobacterium soli]RAK53155.1 peptidylprolyl isomerase [Phenylobacterium soli]